MITDWTKLEVGKFYRLACKCEGLVIKLDHGSKPWETGFWVAYTVQGCAHRTDQREELLKGYGPYVNYFNYDLCTGAMPAEEVPEPDWWKDPGIQARIARTQAYLK